jgi:hypothetical protein
MSERPGFYPLAAKAIAEFGAVYGIRDDVARRIKIGHSVDILRRIVQLQTGSSNRLRVVTFFAGTRDHEQAIHECFEDRRLGGEWFDDSDGLVTDCFVEMARKYGKGFTWIIAGEAGR